MALNRVIGVKQAPWQSAVVMTWTSLLAKILGGFVLVSLAVSTLPATDSALWLLFFSVVLVVAALADFGLLPTFTRFLAYSLSDSKTGLSENQKALQDVHVREVVSALNRAYLFAMGVAAVTAIALGWFFLTNVVLSTKQPGASWLAWYCVVFGVTVQVYGGKYLVLLHGTGHIGLQKFWESVIDFLTYCVAVSVLLSGGELLALVITLQVGIVVRVACNRTLAQRVVSNIADQDDQAAEPKKVIALAWVAAWRSGLGVVFAYAAIHGTLLFLSQSANVEQLAPLLLSMRLIFVVMAFANAPFYSMIPHLNILYADNRRSEVNNSLRKGMSHTLLLYSLGVGLIGAFGEKFLILIDSKIGILSSPAWFLLAAAFFFERWGALHMQAYTISNTVKWHIVNGFGLIAVIVVNLVPLAWDIETRTISAYLISYALIVAPISLFFSYRHFQFNVSSYERSTSILALAVFGLFVFIGLGIN